MYSRAIYHGPKAKMQLSRRLPPFALLSLVLGYLLFWPVPIDPVAWQPTTNPRTVPNGSLSGVHSLPNVGPGPESVAIGHDGRLYSGLQDGNVVRMRADGRGVETFAHTGGQSLKAIDEHEVCFPVYGIGIE